MTQLANTQMEPTRRLSRGIMALRRAAHLERQPDTNSGAAMGLISRSVLWFALLLLVPGIAMAQGWANVLS